jgi:hypothetical protein
MTVTNQRYRCTRSARVFAVTAPLLMLLSGCAQPPAVSPVLSQSRARAPNTQSGCPCLYVAGGAVAVFSLDASGSSAPIELISGKKTLLGVTNGVALDGSNNIWVTNFMNGPGGGLGNGYITEYAAGANGNVSPINVITNVQNPWGIAYDPVNHFMYVADNASQVPNGTPSVVWFSTSGSPSSPIGSIEGSKTYLREPTSVAIDATGKIYVANDLSATKLPGGGSVAEYAPNATGNQRPEAVIKSKRGKYYIDDPFGLALDRSDDVYVADQYGPPPGYREGLVSIYAAGAKGAAKPERTIYGDRTGLGYGYGVAVDQSGDIYVATEVEGSSHAGKVEVFAPNAKGNKAPIKIFPGGKYFAAATGLLVH